MRLTSSNECAVVQLSELSKVVGLVSDVNLGVACNPWLNHVQVCQTKLVQLICEVAVGRVGLVICYIAKLTIRRKPKSKNLMFSNDWMHVTC